MNTRSQISLLSILIILFSCQTERESGALHEEFEFVISDSIQVDYLGNSFVYDYDRENEVYLAWDSPNKIILFDEEGEIKSQFAFQQDGPDRVYFLFGIGFLEGRVTVMSGQKGLTQFSENGEIYQRIAIPDGYTFINGLSFPAYKIGKEYAYVRPERGGLEWDEFGKILTTVYQSPLLEVFDPETNSIRTTMPFPPGTVYSDGNYYNWMYPTILKAGDEWLVYFMAEMKYHVYRQVGDEIEFVKSVDMEVKNSIEMPGVPMHQYELWDEKYSNLVFGRIEQIFQRKNDIVLIYTKGVSEDISRNYDRENQMEYWAFRNGLPRYAAIFDKSHQLIKNDIELPKGLLFSNVLSKNGEILAKKDQDAFGVEEAFETYYKLDLNKKNLER